MRHSLGLTAVCAMVGLCVSQAHAQQNAFPLAAPAGVDSKARERALAGAVNQGPFDAGTWKYGPAFNPPPGTKV